MKIAFCGDSFVVDTTDKSWPGLLSKEYNAEILCKGTSGLSLFNAYERMLENIKEADLIIFCITDPSRLSSPFKLPITTWQASDKNAFIEDSADSYEWFKLLSDSDSIPFHRMR